MLLWSTTHLRFRAGWRTVGGNTVIAIIQTGVSIAQHVTLSIPKLEWALIGTVAADPGVLAAICCVAIVTFPGKTQHLDKWDVCM